MKMDDRLSTALTSLPKFSAIAASEIVATISRLLDGNRAAIDALLDDSFAASWAGVVAPLEAINDRLNRTWSPIDHLHNVADNDALRSAYNEALPLLSRYAAELAQDERLYEAYQAIARSDEFDEFDVAQRATIKLALRDFRLGGIELDPRSQDRFRAIVEELAQLGTRFEENVLDATRAWRKQITSADALRGLPESVLALTAENARREDSDGWLLTLDYPCYLPVMTYAEDRSLREEVYTAFVTRASDAGPDAGKFDNSRIMDEILGLRHELALLLGFDNYSEYSLATKMAGTTSEVLDFLNDLARRSKPYAVREYDELCRFAADAFGVTELQAWDVGFYAEKLRQSKYAISQEELRPYLPVPRVIDGLFSIVSRLFGIEIGGVDGVDTWNPGVRVFQVRDRSGEHLGLFYLDLYARDHKRGGAWMDECVIRRRSDDTLQHPVAYINCNFTPPIGDEPSLLTHAEVITLFHEFGHGLHHLLTAIDYAAVSGINGVPWDAIELPSQFLENWCWEREAIAALSGHVETGEPLPQELFERLYRAKNFHAAMQMVRQLEFAIFDIRLHSEYRPGSSIQKLLDEVREQVAVVKPPRFNRFQNGFSHIFASGYAAGYYSYKWAEVLSADAFSRFEEEGIFNPDTGRSFRATVLERGGSEDAATLFESFRGRPPRIDALLRHSGLEA